MHKNAQVHHLFTYIFSIVAAGLVILFGYFAIKELTSLSEESRLVDFRAEMVKELKGINTDDRKVLKFDMPSKIKEVCFVDIDGVRKPPSQGGGISAGLNARHPIIADKVSSGTRDNFFLVNDKNAIEFSENIGRVILGGPNWYCKSVENNRIVLNVTGESEGWSFARFELIEPLPTAKDISLDFSNILKGLKLTVKPQGIEGSIKFEIKSGGRGISDSFKISGDQISPTGERIAKSDWNPPLELEYPLDETICKSKGYSTLLACCTNSRFNVDVAGTSKVYIPNCGDQKIPKFSIDKT